MSFPHWALLLGALLLAMVLVGTLLRRLPLSGPMVYLLLGFLLGPAVGDVLHPDPFVDVKTLHRLAETALLISLFTAGLKLGTSAPWRQWAVAVRLATVTMLLTIGGVVLAAMLLLQWPLGAAVLLGAILAPTDPVLASGVHVDDDDGQDPVGFSLAGEGALNDGTAFPFAMLGLGLLGLHDLGASGAAWWGWDLLWSTVAGLAVGAALGGATGALVVYLRSRHAEAVGQDAFLGLGLIALTYGAAHLVAASGFLAVFAAGLTLRRVREHPRPGTAPLPSTPDVGGHAYEVLATHSHHASATMRHSVLGFNQQMETFVELALVLVVGAMLAYVPPPTAVLLWFVPLLLLVLRPLSVALTTGRCGLSRVQRALLAWFGIRGIGSVFYVLLALREGVDPDTGRWLLSLTLWTVAASIVLHGITARPLMRWYGARRAPASVLARPDPCPQGRS